MLPIQSGFSGSVVPGTQIIANNVWFSGLFNRNNGINLNVKLHTKADENIDVIDKVTEKPILDQVKKESLNEMSEKQICFIGHSCTWLPSSIKLKIPEEIDQHLDRKIVFLGHSCTWLPKSSVPVLMSSKIESSINQNETIENNFKNEIKKDDTSEMIKLDSDLKLDKHNSVISQINRTNISERINITKSKKNIAPVIEKICKKDESVPHMSSIASVVGSVVPQKGSPLKIDTKKLLKIDKDYVEITTESNNSSKQEKNISEKPNINHPINTQPIKIIESTVVVDKITKNLKIVPTKEYFNLTETFKQQPIKKNVALMGQSSAWIEDEMISYQYTNDITNQNLQNTAISENSITRNKVEKLDSSQNSKSLPDITLLENSKIDEMESKVGHYPNEGLKNTKSGVASSKSNSNLHKTSLPKDNLKIVSAQKQDIAVNMMSDNISVSEKPELGSHYGVKQMGSTNHMKYEKDNNIHSEKTYYKEVKNDNQKRADFTNKPLEDGRLTKTKWIENVFHNQHTNSTPITESISSRDIKIETPIEKISQINDLLNAEHTSDQSQSSNMKPSNQNKIDSPNIVNNNRVDKCSKNAIESIKSEKNLLFMGHSCAWIPENFGITPSPETLIENIEVKEIKNKKLQTEPDSKNQRKIKSMNKGITILKKENVSEVKPTEKETFKRDIVFTGHSCIWVPGKITKAQINKSNLQENNKKNILKSTSNVLNTSKNEKTTLIPPKEFNNASKEPKIRQTLSAIQNETSKFELNKASLNKFSNNGNKSSKIVDKPIELLYSSKSISKEELKHNDTLPAARKDTITKNSTTKSDSKTKPTASPNIGYYIFQDLENNDPGKLDICTTDNNNFKNSDKIKIQNKILPNKINESQQGVEVTNIINPSKNSAFILIEDLTNEKHQKVCSISSKKNEIVNKSKNEETGFNTNNNNLINNTNNNNDRENIIQTVPNKLEDGTKAHQIESKVVLPKQVEKMESNSKKTPTFVIHDKKFIKKCDKIEKENTNMKNIDNNKLQPKNQEKKRTEVRRSRIPVNKSKKGDNGSFKNTGQLGNETIILSFNENGDLNSSGNKTVNFSEPAKPANLNEDNITKSFTLCKNEIPESISANTDSAMKLLKKSKVDGYNIYNLSVKKDVIEKSGSQEKFINTQSQGTIIEDKNDILKKADENSVHSTTKRNIVKDQSDTSITKQFKIESSLKKPSTKNNAETGSGNKSIVLSNVNCAMVPYTGKFKSLLSSPLQTPIKNRKSETDSVNEPIALSNINASIKSIVVPIKVETLKNDIFDEEKTNSSVPPDQKIIDKQLKNPDLKSPKKQRSKSRRRRVAASKKGEIKDINILLSPIEEVKPVISVGPNENVKIINDDSISVNDLNTSKIFINPEIDNLNDENAVKKLQKHNTSSISTPSLSGEQKLESIQKSSPAEANKRSNIKSTVKVLTDVVKDHQNNKQSVENVGMALKPSKIKGSVIQKQKVDIFKMGKTKKLNYMQSEALKLSNLPIKNNKLEKSNEKHKHSIKDNRKLNVSSIIAGVSSNNLPIKNNENEINNEITNEKPTSKKEQKNNISGMTAEVALNNLPIQNNEIKNENHFSKEDQNINISEVSSNNLAVEKQSEIKIEKPIIEEDKKINISEINAKPASNNLLIENNKSEINNEITYKKPTSKQEQKTNISEITAEKSLNNLAIENNGSAINNKIRNDKPTTTAEQKINLSEITAKASNNLRIKNDSEINNEIGNEKHTIQQNEKINISEISEYSEPLKIELKRINVLNNHLNKLKAPKSVKNEEHKSSFVIETKIKEKLENTASKLGILKLTTDEKQYNIPNFNGTQKLNEFQTQSTAKLKVHSNNNFKLTSKENSPTQNEQILKREGLESKRIQDQEKEKEFTLNSPLEKYYSAIDLKLKQLQDDLEKDNSNVKPKIKSKANVKKVEGLADQITIRETSKQFQNILTTTQNINSNQTNTDITINKTIDTVQKTEPIDQKKMYIPLTFSITKSYEEPKPKSTIDKSALNEPNLDQYKRFFKESTMPEEKTTSLNVKTTVFNNSESLYQQFKNMIIEDLFTYPKETKEEIKAQQKQKKEPKSKLSVESCTAQPYPDTPVKPESILKQVKNLIKEELFLVQENSQLSEKLLSKKTTELNLNKTQNMSDGLTQTKQILNPNTKEDDKENGKVLEVMTSDISLSSMDSGEKAAPVTKVLQTDSSKNSSVQSPIKQETLLAQAKSSLINTTSLKAPKKESSDQSIVPRATFPKYQNKIDLVDQFKDHEYSGRINTLKSSFHDSKQSTTQTRSQKIEDIADTATAKTSVNLSNVKELNNKGIVGTFLSGETKLPEKLLRKEAKDINMNKTKETDIEFKPWGETVSHPPSWLDKFKALLKLDSSSTFIQSQNQSEVIKSNKVDDDKKIDVSSEKYTHNENKDSLEVTTESLLKYKTGNLKSAYMEEQHSTKAIKKSDSQKNNVVKSKLTIENVDVSNLLKSDKLEEKDNNIKFDVSSSINQNNTLKNETKSQINLDAEDTSAPKAMFKRIGSYFKNNPEPVSKSEKLESYSQKVEGKIEKFSLLDHLTNINTEQIKYENNIKRLAESKLKPQNEINIKIEDMSKGSESNGLETANIVKSSPAKMIAECNEANNSINNKVATKSNQTIPAMAKNSILPRDDTSQFLDILEAPKPAKSSQSESDSKHSHEVSLTDKKLKQSLKQPKELNKIESTKPYQNEETGNILNTNNKIKKKSLESSLSQYSSLPEQAVKNNIEKSKKVNNVPANEQNYKLDFGIQRLSPQKVLANETSYTNRSFTHENKTLILDNNSVQNDKKHIIIASHSNSQTNPNNNPEMKLDSKIVSNANKTTPKKSSDEKNSPENQKNDTTESKSNESQSKSSIVNFSVLEPTTLKSTKPNQQDSTNSITIPIERDRYNSFEATSFNKNEIVVKILHSLKLASIKKD